MLRWQIGTLVAVGLTLSCCGSTQLHSTEADATFRPAPVSCGTAHPTPAQYKKTSTRFNIRCTAPIEVLYGTRSTL
jgi:hypothetical protein